MRIARALVLCLLPSLAAAQPIQPVQLVHRFTSSPSHPHGAMVQVPDGSFYGLADDAIYRVAPDATVSIVARTSEGHDADGARFTTDYGPDAALIRGPDGALYGTRRFGGSGGRGVVFRFDPVTAAVRTLHAFDGGNDGGHPIGGLVVAGGFLVRRHRQHDLPDRPDDRRDRDRIPLSRIRVHRSEPLRQSERPAHAGLGRDALRHDPVRFGGRRGWHALPLRSGCAHGDGAAPLRQPDGIPGGAPPARGRRTPVRRLSGRVEPPAASGVSIPTTSAFAVLQCRSEDRPGGDDAGRQPVWHDAHPEQQRVHTRRGCRHLPAAAGWRRRLHIRDGPDLRSCDDRRRRPRRVDARHRRPAVRLCPDGRAGWRRYRLPLPAGLGSARVRGAPRVRADARRGCRRRRRPFRTTRSMAR